MLHERIQEALNDQINKEMWSAYLYLSMAMKFEDTPLTGVANWFKIQYKEELDHAEIFINYVTSRGGRVILKPIDAVPTEWASPLEAFKETLKHEKVVTASINDIYALTEELNDFATRERLQWFISEQVEEEDTASHLIDQFALIGNDGYGLYSIDKELAARVYSVPSPLANA